MYGIPDEAAGSEPPDLPANPAGEYVPHYRLPM